MLSFWCILQFHEHGVVWRDVKPENFLFANEDDDSPLKAVDFGTAERCKLGEFITARAGSVDLLDWSKCSLWSLLRTGSRSLNHTSYLILHRVSALCGARGASAEVQPQACPKSCKVCELPRL